jgi:hypothetical protein
VSDYSLPPRSTLLAGMTGSGKTTFAFRYLLNAPVAARFIFDDRGQAANRLQKKHVGTANECEAALLTRWIVFNPSRGWPGCLPGTEQGENAFRWFCRWTYEACRRGRGRKILLIDELWKWCSTRKIPIELATVAVEGRVENLELVTATQTPERIPFPIRGSATEAVIFKLQHAKAFEALEELQLPGFDPAKIQALPLGSFIAWNRISGAVTRGRVF